ncbi:uncharacterized protein LOC135930912 [Gordionus sp. m RMFG-2023]|uniref:uncharacterized protein LOC135930912 n=1 Tax=Gordionus sp. m RMFG-2023 TaxID=3053472 RepID=UPI0031FDC0CA
MTFSPITIRTKPYSELITGKSSLTSSDDNGNVSAVRGISLLQLVPKTRTCESAFIPAHYCPCNWIKPYPPKLLKKTSLDNHSSLASDLSKLIKHGVNLTIKKIKNILSSYRHVCLVNELKLHTIMNAIPVTRDYSTPRDFEMLSNLNINKGIARKGDMNGIELSKFEVSKLLKGFVLVFKISPNDAVFEATLNFARLNVSKIFDDITDISRLDWYGSNSYCVDDPLIQTFCHCI